MKATLLVTLFSCFYSLASAQQSTVTWDYDGETRKYIQYIPPVYDANTAVPLVIALHGLGDNAANFQGVGFQSVADTANFIVVYPEALVDQLLTGSTAWNSGAGVAGFILNPDVDDVGFINALIDTMSAQYNIDQNRVYATGFSMGGFMSNRLACELNDRIKAIASVAGTIGGTLTCTPGSEVAVCHFHGTIDGTVGYGTPDGSQDNTFGNNVVDWIDFWTSNNDCGSISLEGQFPNTSNDGLTIDYVEYDGCSNGTRVVHYKVNGADHVWLGPNNDIFYTTEMWKFFLGQSPSNLLPASINEPNLRTIGVYPNPTADVLRMEKIESKILNAAIFSANGQLVKEVSVVTDQIEVSDLERGFYQLMIATEEGLYSSSFIRE